MQIKNGSKFHSERWLERKPGDIANHRKVMVLVSCPGEILSCIKTLRKDLCDIIIIIIPA